MKKALLILSILMILIVCDGCGYVIGSNPGNTSQLYVRVEMFENFTQPYQPGLEIRLKKALIDELMTSGYIVTTKQTKADVTITGRILDHKQTVLSTSTDQEPTEISLKIKIRVYLDFKYGEKKTFTVNPDRETFAVALNEKLADAETRSLTESAHLIMLELSGYEISDR